MRLASLTKTTSYCLATTFLVLILAVNSMAYDIRGVWTGNAKGSIFGAEGSVTITSQQGDDISGIIEGGNIFGRAKFEIRGKIQDNYIYGSRDGNTFQGYLYPDWTIQGVFKGIDGDTYKVHLRRPYNYWGLPQEGWPYD
jgi:hypothetical protein